MPEDNDLFDENLAKLLRGAHGPPQMDPGRKQLAPSCDTNSDGPSRPRGVR